MNAAFYFLPLLFFVPVLLFGFSTCRSHWADIKTIRSSRIEPSPLYLFSPSAPRIFWNDETYVQFIYIYYINNENDGGEWMRVCVCVRVSRTPGTVSDRLVFWFFFSIFDLYIFYDDDMLLTERSRATWRFGYSDRNECCTVLPFFSNKTKTKYDFVSFCKEIVTIHRTHVFFNVL